MGGTCGAGLEPALARGRSMSKTLSLSGLHPQPGRIGNPRIASANPAPFPSLWSGADLIPAERASSPTP